MMRRALTWRNSSPRYSPMPDVAVDELLLGEEHGLATVVVGPLPPERHGLAHRIMISNIRSIRRGRKRRPGPGLMGRCPPDEQGDHPA